MWLSLWFALWTYVLVWPLSLKLARDSGEWSGTRWHAPLFDPVQHYVASWPCRLFENDELDAGLSLLPYAVPFGTLWLLWHDPVMLDAFLWYMALLELCRCITFNVTLLPDSSQQAERRVWWWRYVVGGIHDLIFSGHVAHFYAPLLFLKRIHKLSTEWFHVSLILLVVLSCQILAHRKHYTIDILSAVAFSHWMLDVTSIPQEDAGAT